MFTIVPQIYGDVPYLPMEVIHFYCFVYTVCFTCIYFASNGEIKTVKFQYLIESTTYGMVQILIIRE